MSHSPTETATEYEMLKYDRGWAALNRMLRAGASFSGRERDCCYLNLGPGSVGPAFANVSAATGLDHPGDGRALALVDWDFDGDEDFWITSRTGPRLRFLRNDLANGNRYVALQLQGSSCNRDAIGARVEVHQTAEDSHPLIKTLYAGHGYLSQSSKWLHFGLGPSGQVDHIVVRWPDGKTVDTFRDVAANRHNVLRQGGKAESWQPQRGHIALTAKTAEEPKSPTRGRVVILRPPPLPRIEYLDESVNKRRLGDPPGGPLLVNLWATWCQPCIAEMTEWGEHAAEFQNKGLKVLALCVDQPSDDITTQRRQVSQRLASFKGPMSLAWPVDGTVEMFDILQRTYVSRQRPIPVPTSFLLDSKSRLAAVYLGPVSAKQVLDDVSLLEQPLDRVRERAVPFGGRWYSPTEPTAPAVIAGELLDGGKFAAAKSYLQQILALHESELQTAQEARRKESLQSQLAATHETLGRIAFDEKRYQDAATAYTEAVKFAPESRGAHLELARTYSALKQPAKVAEHLEAVLKTRRTDPENLRRLAMLKAELRDWDQAAALMREVIAIKPTSREHAILARIHVSAGDFSRAIEQFRQALALEPELAAAANDLAWVLATCPDEKVRNGKEALKLAEKLCPATQTSPPEYLDTLAAAYAETGRFDQAVKTIDQAIRQSDRDKNSSFVKDLEARRRLYQFSKPHRLSAGPQ